MYELLKTAEVSGLRRAVEQEKIDILLKVPPGLFPATPALGSLSRLPTKDCCATGPMGAQLRFRWSTLGW